MSLDLGLMRLDHSHSSGTYHPQLHNLQQPVTVDFPK